MTEAEVATGLVVAGQTFRLPWPSRRIEGAPAARPIPGAPPVLRGIATVEGRSVPVWACSSHPRAWILAERPDGPVAYGGDAVTMAAADDPMLDLPPLVALPPPAPLPLPAATTAAATLQGHRTARAAPIPGSYLLRLGAAAAAVPLSALEAVLPASGCARPERTNPLPPGAVGLVTLDGRRALVLDPAWCFGASDLGPHALFALLRVEDRLLAVPAAQALPGVSAARLDVRLAETDAGRTLLAAAPPAQPPPPPRPARPVLQVLLCQAGERRFALPEQDVAAVLAPRGVLLGRAGNAQGLRGVVAHRGEVLPVVDLHGRIAAPLAAAALAGAPLLRLPLARPLAVAVQRVLGLRAVDAEAVDRSAREPGLLGLASLDGGEVAIWRAAAISAGSDAH